MAGGRNRHRVVHQEEPLDVRVDRGLRLRRDLRAVDDRHVDDLGLGVRAPLRQRSCIEFTMPSLGGTSSAVMISGAWTSSPPSWETA